MQDIGQRAPSAATQPGAPAGAARWRAFALLGVVCAGLPAIVMWGFTVDDALIPVRYARNLTAGAGYRFDAQGPSTDGVTPLPWAFLVAPLVAPDPVTTLVRLKVLGVLAWAVSGGVLGARTAALLRDEARRAVVALGAAGLVVMALAFPIGAWAASGMETAVAMGLATVAATRVGLGRGRATAVLAGLAAAFRPEMVVWAVVMAAGAAILGGRRGASASGGFDVRRRAIVAALLAAGPFIACAVIRSLVFGRPAPLAVLAKPSDLAHGLAYAGAASLVVLVPLLALAPVALLRGRVTGLVGRPSEANNAEAASHGEGDADAGAEPGHATTGAARVLVLAFLAHLAAVIAVGGDWMPYARLVVPVVPSLVIVFAVVARAARPAWSAARVAAATVLGVLLGARAAPPGRHVHGDRADLVARARPVLAGARVVAALDVGWVGAATEARIVDLAGLTDPAIAMLPGGHTSKRVDVAMLLDRGVDTVVVYSDARTVERRIVTSELFASRFAETSKLPVGSRGAFYTVYRRAAPPTP